MNWLWATVLCAGVPSIFAGANIRVPPSQLILSPFLPRDTLRLSPLGLVCRVDETRSEPQSASQHLCTGLWFIVSFFAMAGKHEFKNRP